MKTAKSYDSATRLSFRPELTHCPHCQSRLRRSHTAWRKHIFTLKGLFYTTCYGFVCTNPGCPSGRIVHRSAVAESMSLKFFSFGLDVVARTAYLRIREKRTLEEIALNLWTEHQVTISLKEVHNLLQAYYVLNSCYHELDQSSLDGMRKNGIILSIDGVLPEKGNDCLFLLRDTISGTILLAESLDIQSADQIARLIEKVKSLGVRILAVISDKQKEIVMAVERTLPGVPHQFCHFHFYNNLARPVVRLDGNLKTQLRKRLRRVGDIEAAARKMGEGSKSRSGSGSGSCGSEAREEKGERERQEEVEVEVEVEVGVGVVLDFCNAVRTASLTQGKYPLDPGGLKLYENTRSISSSVQRCLERRDSRLLRRLDRMLLAYKEFEERYRVVSWLYLYIFQVCRILSQDAGPDRVKADLGEFLDSLGLMINLDLFPYCDEIGPDKVFDALKNMVKIAQSFWDGLFYTYGDSRIPKTNNDMESLIGFFKVGQRRITGRRSCQSFVVRWGSLFVLVDFGADQEQILRTVRSIPYSMFRRRREEFLERDEKHRKRYRIRRNLASFLASLEKRWEAIDQSAR